jgi:hypothetical protein
MIATSKDKFNHDRHPWDMFLHLVVEVFDYLH